MLVEPAVLALSLAYLGLLFAVAYFGDRYARDWSKNSVAPVVYGLSLPICGMSPDQPMVMARLPLARSSK